MSKRYAKMNNAIPVNGTVKDAKVEQPPKQPEPQTEEQPKESWWARVKKSPKTRKWVERGLKVLEFAGVAGCAFAGGVAAAKWTDAHRQQDLPEPEQDEPKNEQTENSEPTTVEWTEF